MFSEYFKQRRKELGYTVRKFALEKGLDAGYVSRLENGLMQPPADGGKLQNLAVALELKQGTKEWSEFMDLAAVARNEVPVDLRSNEYIAKVLPAFYRSVRNKQLDEEDVNKLINLIDEARKE